MDAPLVGEDDEAAALVGEKRLDHAVGCFGSLECFHGLGAAQVPDAGRLVVAGGGELFAIRRKREAQDGMGMGLPVVIFRPEATSQRWMNAWVPEASVLPSGEKARQ